MLNTINCKNSFYLSYIFKQSQRGNNNILYFGDTNAALKDTSFFCNKNNVPNHVIDMKRPLHSQQDIIHILSATKKHGRYSSLLDYIPKNHQSSTVFDALNFITTYSTSSPKQNILTIKNFHPNNYSAWEYDIFCSITRLNRFCLGSVLFIHSETN
jgi:hypothetical protein